MGKCGRRGANVACPRYFENRAGEQWVFVYDRVGQTGELRGGDLDWDTVVPVRGG